MTLQRSVAVALCLGLLPLSLGLKTPSQKREIDVLKYVNPLIGTDNGGHVFAGATLPFGMAKSVADVNSDDEKQGGFASDNSQITGFSHMHDSGTGGAPSLGNFPLFPQTGCAGDDVDNCFFSKTDRASDRVNGSVIATPGYFSITLNTSVKAEMTVTNHTALYRFTFPTGLNATSANSTADLPLSPLILVDLSDLPESTISSSVSVNRFTGRLSGSGTFSPSFGIGTYVLYFCADFEGAAVRNVSVYNTDSPDRGSPAGAWTQFEAPTTDDNSILARVGVSFISVDKACNNAETELPNFDFEGTKQAAEDVWREKLNVIEVNASGVDDELQTVFWSGIYRSMISPQDYTGENPLWTSDQPYYDSYYCIWDSFRSVHPLITLLDPCSQSRMVQSLLDIYKNEGKLPDCRMSLCKGYTQGGSNAEVVITDSYLKNISGPDWDLAYEAVVSDAEVEPENWDVEGRGGLTSWKNLNYIPEDDYDPDGSGTETRSVSRTVEYAYDDFCIAELAKALGHTDDEAKYFERSNNWQNLFKANQTSSIPYSTGTVDSGFVGYLQPKWLNGTWAYQDPTRCSPLNGFTSCYLNPDGGETYEGSAWMYTFYAPQDMATLIEMLGGPSSFVDRLEYLHDSGLLYIGDEQAFLPVFQFHYGGRPALSSHYAHYYIPSQFNDTISGLAGNDDSGAMGSFIALSMMGLWPMPGQDVYLITPPFFEEVSITSGQTGAIATIKNIHFDPKYSNIYIQSATLNGVPYTKNWITHSFYLEGGILELTLGASESSWGQADADLPPSSSTS